MNSIYYHKGNDSDNGYFSVEDPYRSPRYRSLELCLLSLISGRFVVKRFSPSGSRTLVQCKPVR